jgi:DNA replication protein DnaC
MNVVELDHALRQLRLSGMASVLETRLHQAQTERLAPIDFLSAFVSDELLRRQDRLLERRHKQAHFRDPERSLDTFDFDFNKGPARLGRSRSARTQRATSSRVAVSGSEARSAPESAPDAAPEQRKPR